MKKTGIIVIRIILIIIILFITSIIFSFSNQNATESSGISAKVAEKLIEIQPKYKNITAEEKAELVKAYQKPVRKGAHFSIYTVLSISIASLTCTFKTENRKRMIITLIAGFLYAVSDEIHQTFIEGRSGQVSDVILDTTGVLLGIIIVIGINSIYKKMKKEKELEKA